MTHSAEELVLATRAREARKSRTRKDKQIAELIRERDELRTLLHNAVELIERKQGSPQEGVILMQVHLTAEESMFDGELPDKTYDIAAMRKALATKKET